MFFVVSLCVICLASAFVLFGRIAVTLAIKLVPGSRTVSVDIHWMHPSMLRGERDATSKVLKLWLFGRLRVWPPRTPKQARHLPPHRTPPPPPSAGPVSESFRHTRSQGNTSDADAAPPETREVHFGNDEDHRFQGKEARVKGRPLKEKISTLINKIRKSGFVRALYFISQASWRGKTVRWIQRCVYYLPRLCRIHATDLHVRLGLDDPALTGKLFGYWTGMKNGIFYGNTNGRGWTFDPVFNEKYLSIEGSISLRSSLIRFIMLFALAFATFPYFTTFKTWRASGR